MEQGSLPACGPDNLARTTRLAAALQPSVARGLGSGNVLPALLGFGTVFGLAAVNGGFFPTSWGWAALSLLLVAAGALVVRDTVPLDRWQTAFLALLGALVGWTALSTLWAPDPATPLLETERACVYLGAV